MPNADRRLQSLLLSTFVGTLAVLIGEAASISELVDLSAFVGRLERGCQLSDPLAVFRSNLNARYTFEDGADRLRKKVQIPESFASAIGQAHAANRGEYTEIVVPLSGVYRGLRTHSSSFSIGHSNGVNVTTLAFDASRSETEAVIGPDVATAQRSFESDPEEREFGFSVRIVGLPRSSALICNKST